MTYGAYGGFVPFESGEFFSDAPISTDAGRKLVQNVRYFIDHAGQVRVNWIAPDGEYLPIRRTSPTANKFYPIFSVRVPMRVHPESGSTYKLRVRLGGYCDKAGTAYFRMAVGGTDRDRNIDAPTVAGGNHVVDYSTTSTTPTWLSTGDIIYPDTDAVVLNTVPFAAREPGGIEVSVPVCFMPITIWGASGAGSALPRVTGIVVQEWIGL